MVPAPYVRLAFHELATAVYLLPPRTALGAAHTQTNFGSNSQSSSPPPVGRAQRVLVFFEKLSPDMVPTCSKAQSRSKFLDINSCLVFPCHNFHSFLIFQNWHLNGNCNAFVPSWLLCCAAHVVHTTGLMFSLLLNLWIWLEGKICPGWQTYA